MYYPKISIVTPSYNCKELIAQTIHSVLNQNYPNLEFIVIDGDSTDGTQQVLEQYSNSFAYWHSQKDQGQYDAINQGFAKSTGEIMGWLNADDMLLPNSLFVIAEVFAQQMEQVGRGTIAVIGSVAGDRGRKTNYVYGAAKGMVERYVQGMQHRFAHSKITIVLIKPGPTATPMTEHLPQRGMASAEAVASRIIAAIDAGTPVAYVPAKWAIIMMVIRHLPRAIFNKLNI